MPMLETAGRAIEKFLHERHWNPIITYWGALVGFICFGLGVGYGMTDKHPYFASILFFIAFLQLLAGMWRIWKVQYRIKWTCTAAGFLLFIWGDYQWVKSLNQPMPDSTVSTVGFLKSHPSLIPWLLVMMLGFLLASAFRDTIRQQALIKELQEINQRLRGDIIAQDQHLHHIASELEMRGITIRQLEGFKQQQEDKLQQTQHELQYFRQETKRLEQELLTFKEVKPDHPALETRISELANQMKSFLDASGPSSPTLAHIHKIHDGYMLRFDQRVHTTVHELGELGVVDYDLNTLVKKDTHPDYEIKTIANKLLALRDRLISKQHESTQQQDNPAVIPPDVALLWDWTEEVKRNLSLLGKETEKEILIHNRSTRYIYNVQIENIPLYQELVFDLINEIGPNALHPTLGRWDGMSTLTAKISEFFCNQHNAEKALEKKWIRDKVHQRGLSPQFYQIPVAVRFESNGTKWRQEFEFIYDIGDESMFLKTTGQRLG